MVIVTLLQVNNRRKHQDLFSTLEPKDDIIT